VRDKLAQLGITEQDVEDAVMHASHTVIFLSSVGVCGTHPNPPG